MNDDEQGSVTRKEDSQPTEELERRKFLQRVCLGVGSASAGLVTVPPAIFAVAPLFRHVTEVWRSVGPVEQFAIGETVKVEYENPGSLPWAGVTAHTAAWLRRNSSDSYTAFSVNCTHLGCPVRWRASADLFMCPCHGGVYYGDGRVAAGPPPRPLPQYPVRVNAGLVQVRTSPVPLTTSSTSPPDRVSRQR